jgi:D-alanine-D-alanine ligase
MAEQVVILFGGHSDERRVSVASAQHICSLVDGVDAWFESPSGEVFRTDIEALKAHKDPFTRDFPVTGSATWPTLADALDDPRSAVLTFFLAYHGTGGEDGTVQRELEKRHLAFTGSGSKASADAFDKAKAKVLASRAGIRTVLSREVPLQEPQIRAELESMLVQFGRAVAKPIEGGSSVGLIHVTNAEQAAAAARSIASQRQRYLVEAFVAGTELTVGVVEAPSSGTRALPPSEVRVKPGRAFDYEGKYLGQGTIEVTPAEVPASVTRAAQEMALAAHRALGCEGYSRTDLIVDSQGPVFLEINTLPGLTRASFIPQQLAAEGSTVKEFILEQLTLARRRQDRARPEPRAVPTRV